MCNLNENRTAKWSFAFAPVLILAEMKEAWKNPAIMKILTHTYIHDAHTNGV